MSTQKQRDEEEYVATFADFKRIFRRNKKRIFYCACVFALLAGLFGVSRPVMYPIHATFKEVGKGHDSDSGALGLILGNASSSKASDATSWMQSSKLMKRVIKELGLQGAILPKKRKLKDIIDRVRGNIKTEIALLLNRPSPGLPTPTRLFSLSGVNYQGEVPLVMEVQFDVEGHYFLHDKQGNILGEGDLDQPHLGDNYAFTIHYHGKAPISRDLYEIILEPIETLATRLQKKIEFDTDKKDKDLLKISFPYADRHMGAEIVNQLMAHYRKHREEEQKRVTAFQIAYLEKRQLEAHKALRKTMGQFAKEQASDVATSGFPNATHALEFLGVSQKEQQQKLMIIDLEIQRLKKVLEAGCAYYNRFHIDGDPAVINSLLNEMRGLKQQADSINLSLHQFLPEDKESPNLSFAKQMAKLEDVQKTLKELNDITKSLEVDELSTPSKDLLEDRRFMVRSWHEKMTQFQEDNHWGRLTEDAWNKHKEQYQIYLQNLIQLFRVHEKAISERIAQHGDLNEEFQGIDLAMAKELFLENNRQLNTIDSEILQYRFVIENLQDPEFSINCLQTLLRDPISDSIITKYSELLFAMKDQGHRSEKERERIKNELLLQRGFLEMHLSQTLQIKSLTANLIRKRIYTLQKLSLALIQQQISLLEKQLRDYITNRIENLSQEKLVIGSSLEKLKKEMAKLPERWYSEQLITQQLEMNRDFGKEITQLVESKNIATNLEVVKSTPIDVATPPIFPKSPLILLFMFAGGGLGAILSTCYFVAQEAFTGLRASEDNLRELGAHVSGFVSKKHFSSGKDPLHDQSLSTLRRVVGHLCPDAKPHHPPGNAALVIGMEGRGFCEELAFIAQKKGVKTLLLPLSFNSAKGESEEGGLLQYLEGEIEKPKIYHAGAIDFIEAGGITRFGTELISSKRFETLLVDLCREYDWVLAYSDAPATSVEGECFIRIFDNVCACLEDERLQDLNFLLNLEKEDGKRKTTFIIKV